MDAALSHILTTWGAPGAIIVLLTTLLGYIVKQFQTEREKMTATASSSTSRANGKSRPG